MGHGLIIIDCAIEHRPLPAAEISNEQINQSGSVDLYRN